MDGPTGLDYAGVAVTASALGTPLDDTVLRFIQRLECERLKFIDEKRKEKAEKK